jgi:hypothetical protein
MVTMPWYLTAALWIILGWTLNAVVHTIHERIDMRPIDPKITAQFQPAVVPPPGGGAADILGYRDLSGRYITPTHPVTRGAHNSAAALSAWDRRNRKEVA